MICWKKRRASSSLSWARTGAQWPKGNHPAATSNHGKRQQCGWAGAALEGEHAAPRAPAQRMGSPCRAAQCSQTAPHQTRVPSPQKYPWACRSPRTCAPACPALGARGQRSGRHVGVHALSNDVGVPEHAQNLDLAPHLLAHAQLGNALPVHDLDGNQPPRRLMFRHCSAGETRRPPASARGRDLLQTRRYPRFTFPNDPMPSVLRSL